MIFRGQAMNFRDFGELVCKIKNKNILTHSIINNMKKNNLKNEQQCAIHDVMLSLPTMDEIKLEPVYGSTYCQYSVIENKLEILYKNQEKLLQAIKLLGNRA